MPDELPPLPGYTIFGELGRGGMGVIYKAHQVALDRPVALKVLRSDAGPEAKDRFAAEAEAAARLRHGHIAQVYDAGTWAGRPYFAMEFLEGGTLARKLAHTPQPPAYAAAVVEALARAVQHAHERGVVHRDLKPANVLLTADGTPKIADFGLAKQTGSGLGTRTGDLLGTPSYMAPEQAAGRAHTSGPAGDVYALGAILYECLTGRPPFRGATLVETLEQVQTQAVEPPGRFVPGLPVDLEAVCLKCLRKTPAGRYATAGELAEDLGRFLAGLPVKARPAGLSGRLRYWGRRNPTAAVLVGVLAAYAAAVTAMAVWLWHHG